MAVPRILRAFLCLLLGHRPVRGAAVFAPATLQIHQLDGSVVQRAASTRTFPVTCAYARTPTERIPRRHRRAGRALGREWRAHFLACPACYDVWAHDSATHGVKVLQPARPEVTH